MIVTREGVIDYQRACRSDSYTRDDDRKGRKKDLRHRSMVARAKTTDPRHRWKRNCTLWIWFGTEYFLYVDFHLGIPYVDFISLDG